MCFQELLERHAGRKRIATNDTNSDFVVQPQRKRQLYERTKDHTDSEFVVQPQLMGANSF